MAVDILSIPAMSAETERVLSDAKLTIPPNRNQIGEDIIEATECLNRWYRADISR
jgi:hAT family C-terminal dimerisation region